MSNYEVSNYEREIWEYMRRVGDRDGPDGKWPPMPWFIRERRLRPRAAEFIRDTLGEIDKITQEDEVKDGDND